SDLCRPNSGLQAAATARGRPASRPKRLRCGLSVRSSPRNHVDGATPIPVNGRRPLIAHLAHPLQRLIQAGMEIGAALRDAREKRGLSLAELSARTKIR